MVQSKKTNGIFTAIGAATGLGNALRFPSLCFNYGGAFVFAYVLSLVLVCFPLLSAELQLGKLYDTPLNKTLKTCAPKLSWLAYSAAINSAVIAIYYCVICAKLGGAFFAFTSSGEAGDVGGVSLYAAGALSVAAVWFIMRGKNRIARSGILSVIGSLTVLAVLAALVLAKGAGLLNVFGFCFADLRSGGLWADALGQSLLALSLAGGVMPTFARSFDKHFSAPKTAAKIIAFNFSGCLLAAVAALGLSVPVPQGGGVTVALKLYPQVIASAVANPVLRRMFGTAFFAFLWLVAIQSACSLLSPAIGLVKSERRNFAIALSCAASFALLPVLAAKVCAAMFALDRMACSVNAVIIAFFEVFIFNYPRNMPRLTYNSGKITSVLLKLFCPFACGALALFSLCGARFSCFPFYAVAIALSALIAVFAPAFLYAFKAAKERVNRFTWHKSHKHI